MQKPTNILITGANSGLGDALARRYADRDVTLYLTGRNEDRLEKTKQECQKLGAAVQIYVIDVRDEAALSAWIKQIGRLDLVIANAGISAGTGGGGESVTQVKNIFDTNIYGVINTIHPAIDKMKGQGTGQVAIISSLAGYRASTTEVC